MNYLFFDTETTGLPFDYKAHFTDVHNWPRVVQLAWILTNEHGSTLEQASYIIKPEGYTIPPGMIHGITQEKAEEEGFEAEMVFEHFANAIFADSEGRLIFDRSQSPTLVAHNIGFDLPIVSAELIRLDVANLANAINRQVHHQCTQAIGTNYCKIPGRGYGKYKWPKLSELHQKLFNEDFDGAHDAMNDVKATAKCFFELKRLGVIN